MPSTFPTTVDTFPDLSANPQMNDPAADHQVLHIQMNQAIAALESKVGVTNSTNTSSLDFRIRSIEEPVTEIPSGVVNGVNDTFFLSQTPKAGTAVLTLNGVEQREGADYAISGVNIVMVSAPLSPDVLIARYIV